MSACRTLARWEKAKKLVAIEDNQRVTTKPIGTAGPYGEPIEPFETLTNVGEFPTLTDKVKGKRLNRRIPESQAIQVTERPISGPKWN